MAVTKPKLVEPTDPALTDGDDVAEPPPQQTQPTPDPAAPVADDDAAGSRVAAVRMSDLQDLETSMDERYRRLEARLSAGPDDDVAEGPEPVEPVADPVTPSPAYDFPAPPSASRWPWLAVAALAVVAGVLLYLRRRASP